LFVGGVVHDLRNFEFRTSRVMVIEKTPSLRASIRDLPSITGECIAKKNAGGNAWFTVKQAFGLRL
jgi:hypothetical protein